LRLDERFVAASGVPEVRFKKGQCKEDIARPYQDATSANRTQGVVLVGKAQERMEDWNGCGLPSATVSALPPRGAAEGTRSGRDDQLPWRAVLEPLPGVAYIAQWRWYHVEVDRPGERIPKQLRVGLATDLQRR
jgi:hypothetical protein